MTPLFLGIIVAVVAVGAFVTWFFWPVSACNHDCTEARYLADRNHADRRWVQGVMAVYRGDAGDPAYWDAGCAGNQASSWSMEAPADLQELLERYRDGEINVAFDKARLIWLARLGQGLGWLSEAQSWQWCAEAGAALRAHYADWAAFRHDMEAGRASWYNGSPPPEQLERGKENYEFAVARVLPQLAFR
jgi:hypothetical protein